MYHETIILIDSIFWLPKSFLIEDLDCYFSSSRFTRYNYVLLDYKKLLKKTIKWKLNIFYKQSEEHELFSDITNNFVGNNLEDVEVNSFC